MKKSKAFCLVGFILGSVAFAVSVTAIVFSVLGYLFFKKQLVKRPVKVRFTRG